MLKVENISKTFYNKHSKVKALKNISLTIGNGDFLSIMGLSGSGKSTFLLTLGGMNSPDEGKIFWDNASIYNWGLMKRAEWRAKTIGFIFQTFNLIPYLNVFENVSIAMDLSNKSGTNKEDILKILKRMKLSDRLDHTPNELSVGQQQRVAIARALIKNPQIILADEPTGNLDSQTTSEIINVLKEVNEEGKTVILVSHDNNLAKIAKHQIRIIEGEIVS
jgi:putative ABC transport system ATP-binding protein